MFPMYLCSSVHPDRRAAARGRCDTQSLPSLLLHAWIYSCHSTPTSSTGHNMPHGDVLIKSPSCHHNLTSPFLPPHFSFLRGGAEKRKTHRICPPEFRSTYKSFFLYLNKDKKRKKNAYLLHVAKKEKE